MQSFERRGFQSRTLSDSATGPRLTMPTGTPVACCARAFAERLRVRTGSDAFYLHPQVGLTHRSNGSMTETGLCRMGATMSMTGTGSISGDVRPEHT